MLISEEDQAGIPEDVSEDDSISGLLESESRRANLIFKDQKIQTLKVIDSSVNNERECCSRLALNSKIVFRFLVSAYLFREKVKLNNKI